MFNYTIINSICFTRQSSAFRIIFIALFGISCQHSTPQSNSSSSISDPHSFANFSQVKVRHLNLNLEADFEHKILHGWAELSIEHTGQAKELVLDTRDLQITQIVTDNGKEAMFRLGDTVPYLGQALYIPIDAGCKKVKIYYSTSPDAAAIQWLSPAQTAGGDFPFLFTQSQAILARSWVPCQDGPGNKFTYEATIKCPPELMALMSAENDTLLHKDGIYHFSMQQPIPSYLLALTIGNFRYQSLGPTCGVYTEPPVLEKAVYEFADMQNMIKTASKLYGNYSWGRYDVVVLPPSFPFGGMENPRLTFATPTIIAGDRSLVSLIAHELAHSWSGNLVTNSTWNDFWLNEGFTVYFENRIMEALYGKEYAEMHEVIGYGELQRTLKEMGENSPFTHLKLNMKGMDPDEAVSDIAYEKGRFFLRNIEQVVGREKWDAFLNKYFSQFAFKSLNTEEFLQYLELELIKGDANIKNGIAADAWLYAPGLPPQFKAPHAVAFDQVLAEKERFMKGAKASSLQTKAWSTFHWMHFLRNLPADISTKQMEELDQAFHFSSSGNSEILCDWFQHCIRKRYSPAYTAMEKFLLTVGRRKFIKPLYEGMSRDEQLLPLAKSIYEKARPSYHSVSTHTIDEILKVSFE